MCCFLEKIDTQILEDFEQSLVTKQGSTERTCSFEYNGYNVYLTKVKCWTLFSNLQTKTVSSPDQEKLLEKVLVRLKILINAKN